MNTYLVRVFESGLQRGRATPVEATSAREAMDKLEAKMGLKCGVVIHEGKETIYQIFHPYSFTARLV